MSARQSGPGLSQAYASTSKPPFAQAASCARAAWPKEQPTTARAYPASSSAATWPRAGTGV